MITLQRFTSNTRKTFFFNLEFGKMEFGFIFLLNFVWSLNQHQRVDFALRYYDKCRRKKKTPKLTTISGQYVWFKS